MSYVGKKMIADTLVCGGGVYFREDHLSWISRGHEHPEAHFDVYYKDIADVKVIPTHKKRIDIYANGKVYSIRLYRVNVFMEILKEARENCSKQGSGPLDAAVLQRIAELEKLKEQGAITEEEFNILKSRLMQ